MKARRCLGIILCLGALSGPMFTHQSRVWIAIQPFGSVDSAILSEVKSSIPQMFHVEADILTGRELPASAYYAPRKRYRAEKLLLYLNQIRPEGSTKVLGLTIRDISVLDSERGDWGIIGLGALEGPACIVSTARLQKDGLSEKFHDRLIKVVYHELGHAFGLDHCATQGCLMEDAKGTLKTVDRSTGAFCPECRKKLKGYINP